MTTPSSVQSRVDRDTLEQRLFRGVAAEVEALARDWLPRLRDLAKVTQPPSGREP